jgi:hypothetical protein
VIRGRSILTEGIIQKVFNELITDIENRLEEKIKWIIIRDCYKREKELIEEIKKNVSDWSKQSNPPLPRYVKLDVLIGDTTA